MLTVRPLRPEDADIEFEFVSGLSPETRHNRLLGGLRAITPEYIRELTQVDYSRDMALAATSTAGGRETLAGVARYARDRDGDDAEFAIVVADAWQRRGVGRRLMEELIAAARKHGVTSLYGEILSLNQPMMRLMQKLGFTIGRSPYEATLVRATLKL